MTYPKTDALAMAKAVHDFESRLPGLWWSFGMCRVGAHASCAVDGGGPWAHLLDGIEQDDPLDSGWHADTAKGLPHEALRDVMLQALDDPRIHAQVCEAGRIVGS
jgi:hypothetical protein